MPRAGLTAERLTQAAAELADRDGLHHVTLTALAKQHGVATPSLYAHVRSTEDLKTRIALLALAEMADEAEQATAGRDGKDAVAALGRAYVDYARRHPGRFSAMQLPMDDATAAASAGPRHAALSRRVLGDYRLGRDDETHAVRLLGATFNGYATLDGAGAFSHSRPSSDTTWARILDGLDTLFRTWEKK